LALDVGDKRIGVAVSDELGIIARGLDTIDRISIKKDTDKILELIKEHKTEGIIIGLPLNLDGSDSVQTTKTREFATKIEDKLRSNSLADVKVILHDERFTTKIAEQALIECDVRREKRSSIIDKQAAVVILQSWLDKETTSP